MFMKKLCQKLSVTVFYSRILFLILFSFALVQCKKNEAVKKDDSVTTQKAAKFKELSKEVLSLAKNVAFKQLVYDECKAQKFGDYYVRIEDLLKNPASKISVSPDKSIAISKFIDELKNIGARNPIIFYPSVETKEDNKYFLNSRMTNEEVIAVVEDGSNGGGYTNDQYPGYIFNTDGQLEYSQQITEEFAWNNDVWVIGEEENCSDGNMVEAPEDFILNPEPARFQGQPEYGAIIQVTNLNQLESWIIGKLEFQITVMNSSGGVILGPLGLGKVKRKYFKDLRWYDYNKSIGNWNTPTFGNWMYEHWVEEDGGFSASITITMPPPSGTYAPTISTTIPSKNLDENMGLTTIQFTDLITQVYNVSYANIKRKN
jgi:hypothetical protein